MTKEQDNELGLFVGDVRVQFSQKPDCCGDENMQDMEVLATRSDFGSGWFYCITTKRWAVDDPSEIVKLLELVQEAVQGLTTVEHK